jgi:hypothetical protein
MPIKYSNRVDLSLAYLRNKEEYNQKLTAYAKNETIRQK